MPTAELAHLLLLPEPAQAHATLRAVTAAARRPETAAEGLEPGERDPPMTLLAATRAFQPHRDRRNLKTRSEQTLHKIDPENRADDHRREQPIAGAREVRETHLFLQRNMLYEIPSPGLCC